jgi:DnaK suppressor protein
MNHDQAKAALLEKKAELEARLARTHKHIHGREEPVSARFSEQVKETENDVLVHALDAEGQQELRQVNHALQRLDAGTWSVCSSCGAAIGDARLAAIPFTDLCINCAA